jgi:hypothetical protein
MPDRENVLLDVTNDSSEQSSYIIDVNYLDAAGQRVADEPFFVNYVRAGERAQEETAAFSATRRTASCEIAEVERISAPSTDDTSEVTCEVTGVDFIRDLTTAITATNNSSDVSDYLITAALVRDDIRIGTVDAVVENVRPGQSAPGDGFTTADGPARGVTCEPVYVVRTSSE